MAKYNNFTATIKLPGGGVTDGIVNVSGGLSVDTWDDPAGENLITILWLPGDNPEKTLPVEPLK